VKIAKPVQNLIESFEKLPGVGPKSAQRLAFYLLHVPQHQLDQFGQNLSNLKKNTVLCGICKNVSEKDPCEVCGDSQRDRSVVAVVEQPLDILSFEKTGKYNGLYHVLHGAINPLDNIGPDELFIQQLEDRVKNDDTITEVIIATNPTMEGEATAMYLSKHLTEIRGDLKITRLGMGIPTGAYLEFADELTMQRALEGRTILNG
jgi:recombination protein RecR